MNNSTNFQNIEEKNVPLKTYAAISQNREQANQSASGGIFAAIATQFIEAGGIVFGASFSENYGVSHRAVGNIENLFLLQGSKYVQSRIDNTYQQAKDYLEKGKRLILRETGSGTRWHFDCFRQEHNLPPPRRRCILEISGFDAIKQRVRSGFGISVMSELAIQDELAAGTLSKARFMEGPIRRSINFIYMPNENLKFAEDFISFCRRTTRKNMEKHL